MTAPIRAPGKIGPRLRGDKCRVAALENSDTLAHGGEDFPPVTLQTGQVRNLVVLKDEKDRSCGGKCEWNFRPAILCFLVYKRRDSGARVGRPQFGGKAMHPKRYGYLHGFCLRVPDKIDIRVGGPPVDEVEDFPSFTAPIITVHRIREVRGSAHLSKGASCVGCAVNMPLSVAHFTLAAAFTTPPHLVNRLRIFCLFLRWDLTKRSSRP